MGQVATYDILNAGPRNRFTAADKLVHNCGYQGGVGALITMGALDMGIPEEDLQGIVYAWRDASPNIVNMWYAIDDAAQTCIGQQRNVDLPRYRLSFQFERGCMFIKLPSGRRLCYPKAALKWDETFAKMGIVFWGADQKTKRWSEQRTYGGRLVENIVQATARDCLRDAMLGVDEQMPDTIAFHVHDEIVQEVPVDYADQVKAATLTVMGRELPWAPGLPLKGAGYVTSFYLKD